MKNWHIIFNICSKSTVIFYKEYRYLYKEYGNKSLYFTEFKSTIDFIKYYNLLHSIKGNGKKYRRTAAGLIGNQQSWKPAARC